MIDSAQYHGALIELMQIGWEVEDDPNWEVGAVSLVDPPKAPELRPPPPSVAWMRKVRAMEDSGTDPSLFLYDTVGYNHPP